MTADLLRHFYEYHFSENRSLWNTYVVPLSQEQYLAEVDYSIGSVRHHLVHMASVDRTWFTELRGLDIPEPLNPAQFADRETLRARWDHIEAEMRAYLANLRDDMLNSKPIIDEEDQDLTVGQVLLHVVNHGTDHRAQLLRLLNGFGLKTVSQDYIFYVYDNPT
ncbi:MAG: hypothetical protein GYB68_09635 [Chloroflexi bacterium]|nr:hypothetical protein [Chloroflexota bacterium]